MSHTAERMKILEMIDQGTINAEEGFKLIQALDESENTQIEKGTTELESDSLSAPTPEEMKKWLTWRMIPLWVGAGMTTISAGLMYLAVKQSGYGFWFACTWMPFLLGVLLMALTRNSSHTTWLHVRVQRNPGNTPKRIAFSFPIPIRLTTWGLRNFGHRIPNFNSTARDKLIHALNDPSLQDTPFSLSLNEGNHGNQVQIFIG